jgi:hypothetical protein
LFLIENLLMALFSSSCQEMRGYDSDASAARCRRRSRSRANEGIGLDAALPTRRLTPNVIEVGVGVDGCGLDRGRSHGNTGCLSV